MILLDTHALIWFITADPTLGKQSELLARQALNDNRLVVSAISFWEIAMLTAKRRLEATLSPTDQRREALAAGIEEIPLTGEIAILACGLEDLHGDPIDRFIVATSIAHDATLITADRRLLGWRHKLKRQNARK